MSKLRLLLVDACVLIDFAKTDASLITLLTRYVGEVHVATPVFEEVHHIDSSMAASLGIRLFEPSLETVFAAAKQRGRLSFQDRLSLLVAKANGWTCVSNDRRLRAACEAESVSVMWGLEVLALLVEKNALSGTSARNLANKIAASNKRIGRAVLQRFVARIRAKEAP
jgi:hypothetical protein